MSNVQTILTYTLASKSCETTPPKPPINCGCDDFVLIFKDHSLLDAELHGILKVKIISLTVSSCPVNYISPTTGESSYVWRYDYTVEYNTDSLADPDYRIRRCDLAYNCCYGCAQAYTDNQLEGYVQGVSGCGVTNTDTQNPVINPRVCFTGTDTPTINYTYNNATGDHKADVKVSNDEDNNIEIRGNGLYVPPPPVIPAYPVHSAVDTQTVDSNYNPATFVHSANVRISPNFPNILTSDASGMYVNLCDDATAFDVQAVDVGAINYGVEGYANNNTKFGPINVATIINHSRCKPMRIMVTTDYYFEGKIENGALNELCLLTYQLYHEIAIGSIAVPPADPIPGVQLGVRRSFATLTPVSHFAEESISRTSTYLIPPQGVFKFAAQAVVTHSSNINSYLYTNKYKHEGLRAVVHAMGVALHNN